MQSRRFAAVSVKIPLLSQLSLLMFLSTVYPIRYYLIDFEFAVRFSPNTQLHERVVIGHPLLHLGFDHTTYGRDLAPEMLSNKPHDPFKTDVFQLGCLFFSHFYVGSCSNISLDEILIFLIDIGG